MYIFRTAQLTCFHCQGDPFISRGGTPRRRKGRRGRKTRQFAARKNSLSYRGGQKVPNTVKKAVPVPVQTESRRVPAGTREGRRSRAHTSWCAPRAVDVWIPQQGFLATLRWAVLLLSLSRGQNTRVHTLDDVRRQESDCMPRMHLYCQLRGLHMDTPHSRPAMHATQTHPQPCILTGADGARTSMISRQVTTFLVFVLIMVAM